MAAGSTWPLVAMTGKRYRSFLLLLEGGRALLQLAHSQPALWQGPSHSLRRHVGGRPLQLNTATDGNTGTSAAREAGPSWRHACCLWLTGC